MRIQYTTQTDNIGMKTIGEKIGFKVEGILKMYKLVEGSFRDCYLIAITRDNWNCINKGRCIRDEQEKVYRNSTFHVCTTNFSNWHL